MYKNRLALLTRSFLQPRVSLSKHAYSSLRRVRQTGPRSRVLNHVEAHRVRPVKEMIPKVVTEEALMYERPQPSSEQSTLVEVPFSENQVIKPDSKSAAILTQSAIVIGRELEMMNVFLGYEQANRYKIMDPNGTHIGYIAEEEGFGKSISRQLLKTHRKMNATIFNTEGEVMFKIIRPYSVVNSKIFIYTADDELVGEVQQRWNLVRRKYDLFVGTTQFATIDTPFLGWDFNLQDENGGNLGSVNRNFSGFAREIFTDTGEYVLRMDAVEGNSRGMTLDERAVTLACAISIDFDYFSRHSSHGSGGIMPFPMMGMGGGSEAQKDDNGDLGADGAAIGTGAAMGGIGQGMGGMGQGMGDAGSQAPMPPPPPPSNTNEWGDPFLSDDEAGVSNPSDEGGFFDTLKDFFGDE